MPEVISLEIEFFKVLTILWRVFLTDSFHVAIHYARTMEIFKYDTYIYATCIDVRYRVSIVCIHEIKFLANLYIKKRSTYKLNCVNLFFEAVQCFSPL